MARYTHEIYHSRRETDGVMFTYYYNEKNHHVYSKDGVILNRDWKPNANSPWHLRSIKPKYMVNK